MPQPRPLPVIILASTSPRRIELLNQVKLPVVVRSPKAEEKRKAGESPKAMVSRLARDKALSMVDEAIGHGDRVLIISADTTVVGPDGKAVLEKPKDAKDAQRMLRMLSGKAHIVHTGYCILEVFRSPKLQARAKRVERVVTSKVSIRKLTPKMIEQYVKTGEPMDKAGAYAAQGIGMGFVEKLSGSYTNVVGLPMSQLLVDLEKSFGVSPLEMLIAGKGASG